MVCELALPVAEIASSTNRKRHRVMRMGVSSTKMPLTGNLNKEGGSRWR